MTRAPTKGGRRALLGAAASLAVSGLARRAGAQQVEIQGFRFDPTARVAGSDLLLNGVGVRRRFFIPIYVAGLYVPQRSSDPAELLAQRGPRRMDLRFARDVEAELFMTSLAAGMAKHFAPDQLERWRPQIDALNTVIRTMVLARRGDQISWDYTPQDGGRVVQNSIARIPSVAGEDFYNAVLRVWLGEFPADADLKRGLLGA